MDDISPKAMIPLESIDTEFGAVELEPFVAPQYEGSIMPPPLESLFALEKENWIAGPPRPQSPTRPVDDLSSDKRQTVESEHYKRRRLMLALRQGSKDWSEKELVALRKVIELSSRAAGDTDEFAIDASLASLFLPQRTVSELKAKWESPEFKLYLAATTTTITPRTPHKRPAREQAADHHDNDGTPKKKRRRVSSPYTYTSPQARRLLGRILSQSPKLRGRPRMSLSKPLTSDSVAPKPPSPYDKHSSLQHMDLFSVDQRFASSLDHDKHAGSEEESNTTEIEEGEEEEEEEEELSDDISEGEGKSEGSQPLAWPAHPQRAPQGIDSIATEEGEAGSEEEARRRREGLRLRCIVLAENLLEQDNRPAVVR